MNLFARKLYLQSGKLRFLLLQLSFISEIFKRMGSRKTTHNMDETGFRIGCLDR